MDGSSTETEDPQHFKKAKPKKRAVKKDLPAKKRTKRNDAGDKWKSFLERFAHRLATCQQARRGCYFCGHDCFLKTEPLLDEIRKWRESFSEMTDAVADKEILWIFQNSRQTGFDEQLDQDQHHKQKPRHLQGDQQSSIPSTDTEEANCSSTSTSEPSDDVLHLDCNPEKSQPVAIKPAKREYNPRARTKKPSVKLVTFLKGADRNTTVCLQSSLFFLGMGPGRLNRASQQIQVRFCFSIPTGFFSFNQLDT